MTIHIYREIGDTEYKWKMVLNNGQCIAVSEGSWKNYGHASMQVKLIKENLPKAKVVID